MRTCPPDIGIFSRSGRSAEMDGRSRSHSVRVEAQGLVLSLGALAGLDQKQEPGRARGEARGGGRLGSVTVDAATGIYKPKGAYRVRRAEHPPIRKSEHTAL